MIMKDTQELLKRIVAEMSSPEWNDIRKDLLTGIDSNPACDPGNDNATGLSDQESRLIRKLARKTEELYKIYREGPDQGRNNDIQE